MSQATLAQPTVRGARMDGGERSSVGDGQSPARPTEGLTAAPSLGSPVARLAGPMIVTIDGPAGTGKSTVAQLLAARLGLSFLDTGAMYRAAAAIVIDHGIDPSDARAVVAKVADADLHFDWSLTPPALLAWDRPLDHRLRDADVTALVSPLAVMRELRQHMVLKQRIIAHQHPRLVAEGRDQGSVVFPDALVKFYLDADAGVRARRRAEQLGLVAAGDASPGAMAVLERMAAEIRTRDELDRSREVAPLVCPPDAVPVDTSGLATSQVVDVLERVVRERAAARALEAAGS